MIDQISILIAYGSRYGCIEEISQKLAEFLENEDGFKSTLLNLRETEENLWPSLEKYDGIMIGTGIRIGRWVKEAVSFLKKYKQIDKEKFPVTGVYVSCGSASDPKQYPMAIKDYLESVFVQFGIIPDIYDAFGGIFDFTPSSKLGFVDRRILKWGSRDLCMKKDYSIRNDYRDWNQIKDFSSRFVELLKNK